MKKKRTKVTPRWLSITRKVMTYLGGGTFLTSFFTRFGLSGDNLLFAVECWMTLQVVIQIICDLSYAKEPLEDFTGENKPINS